MAKFEMDTEFIRTLAKLLEETNLGEIEMADGDRKIRVARPSVAAAPAAAPVVLAPAAVPAAALAAAAAGDLSTHPGAVKSPMVGTAYLSPEPGKPLFVSVGEKVVAGQTLLIIEAMKTMNQIPSPRGGTVTAILFEDAQPVEYGMPLVVIE